MSVQAITWALNQRVRSATHKAVLLVLANRMDPTGFGWPSQRLVAREANCSDRTVRRVLLDLEQDGVLIRNDRRRKDGSYSTDAVQFSMPISPADNLAAGPEDNLTDGQFDQRPDTTAPADNLSGLTTFEPNTKNLKGIGDAAKTPRAPSKPKIQTPNLPEAIASYDEAAERCGWVRLKAFTESRRAAARVRWRELGGADGWKSLLAEAERQSFLGGANERGWRMDFDFFVSAKGAAHILEGKYLTADERKAPAQSHSPAELRVARIAWAKAKHEWKPEWGEPDAEVLPFLKAQGANR